MEVAFEFNEKLDEIDVKLILFEKIEKNPEFSSKIGVRNTSKFISSKQSKNE